jgi:hypothetical protein
MNVFKKTVFATTLLLIGSNICFAQEVSICGGFNLSQINLKVGDLVIHREDTKLNPGFNVGPIIEFPLKNIFSLETGILFTSKGFKQSGYSPSFGNYLNKINIFYSEVPVLLKAYYPIGKTKIFGMAGGYAASGLYGYFIRDGNVNSVRQHSKVNIQWGSRMKRLDYGLKFGVGLKIRDCQFGAAYELGLYDIANDETMKS